MLKLARCALDSGGDQTEGLLSVGPRRIYRPSTEAIWLPAPHVAWTHPDEPLFFVLVPRVLLANPNFCQIFLFLVAKRKSTSLSVKNCNVILIHEIWYQASVARFPSWMQKQSTQLLPYQNIGVKMQRHNNLRVNMKNCAYDFEICYSFGSLLTIPSLLLLLQKQTAEIITVSDGKTIISNRIIPHIWPLTKDPIRRDDRVSRQSNGICTQGEREFGLNLLLESYFCWPRRAQHTGWRRCFHRHKGVRKVTKRWLRCWSQQTESN